MWGLGAGVGVICFLHNYVQTERIDICSPGCSSNHFLPVNSDLLPIAPLLLLRFKPLHIPLQPLHQHALEAARAPAAPIGS